MSESQKKTARRRYQGEGEAMCPHCGGKGRILSQGVQDRARKGGNNELSEKSGAGAADHVS